MRRCRLLGHDVEHDDTAHHERVTDHRTMASPRHSFRTHDRCITVMTSLHEQVDRVGELFRLHVVRVPLERGVPPGAVDAVLAYMTQTAQCRHTAVRDLARAYARRQSSLTELRIVPGLGDGTHVDQLPDPVRLQEIDELVDRVRRVSDSVNRDL